ncbi:MAG TPA: hypothetical protein VLA43_20805, partial [Longimicrobiales bacterium]|nr:hypothetical protein [Longimicrobiales bacterium]
MALKPHFLIPWALLAGLAWRQDRRSGSAIRPDVIASGLTGALAVAAVLLFEPAYVSYLREVGPVYLRYSPQSPFFVAVLGEGNAALAILAALVATWVLWRSASARTRRWGLPVALAVLSFDLVAALQLKGWRYHYLPALGLSVVLLVLVLRGTRWQGLGRARALYRALALGTLVVLSAGPLFAALARMSGRVPETFDPDYQALRSVVSEHGAGLPIAVLSTTLASAFPLVPAAGVRSSLRWGSLPWLPALYAGEIGTGRVVKPDTLQAGWALEQKLNRAVVEDLLAHPPGLIIVPVP